MCARCHAPMPHKAPFLKIHRSHLPAHLRDVSNTKWVDFDMAMIEHLIATECVLSAWESRAVGPIISGAPPLVFARCPSNMAKAATLRLFRDTGVFPVRGVWEEMDRFKSVLLPRFAAQDFKTMTEEDWLESMPRVRVKPLRLAAQLLKEHGWSTKWQKFGAFVKNEHSLGAGKDDYGLTSEFDAAPRLIQAPHDVGHVVAGPRLKPLLKLLKREWSVDGPIFYGSATPDKLLTWLRRAVERFPGGCVFWSDYSMFDSTHTAATWNFMERLYGPHMRDELFAAVMECWKRPCGKIGQVFKYQGRVMNGSGRDDTALANGILNGFAMSVCAAAAWYSIPMARVSSSMLSGFLSETCQLSVCGDDALGFLPGMSEQRRLQFVGDLRACLSQCGFAAKAFVSQEFTDAVYLGHRPIRAGGQWWWGRTIGRCIYKLGWQCGIKGDPAAYMTGIMDMHLLCNPHVPIVADMAKAYLRHREGRKRTPVVKDPNKPWEWMCTGLLAPSYDQETLESVADAYSKRRDATTGALVPTETHITVDDLKEAISHIHEVVKSAQPCVLDHWVLKHMVWVDEQ